MITAKNDEHPHNLEQVLTRLKLAGLQAKKKKCSFLQASVEYLGHRIDAEGLHPTNEKVRVVKDAPNPLNKTELRSFLCLINYYAKFLLDLSNILSPLYQLTKKNVAWRWEKDMRVAFQRAVGLISTYKCWFTTTLSFPYCLSVMPVPEAWGLCSRINSQMEPNDLWHFLLTALLRLRELQPYYDCLLH